MSLFTPLAGQKNLTIQPYHWMADYYREMSLRSLDQLAFGSTKPVLYRNVAQWQPAQSGSFFYHRLTENLDSYSKTGKQELTVPTVQFGVLLDNHTGDLASNDLNQISFRFYTSARLTENISVFNAVNLDQRFGEDEDYLGKKWRDITAISEQAYALYTTERFTAKFGRDYLFWGPGKDAALSVSDASRPFDQLFLQFQTRRAQFSYFFSKLNSVKLPGDVADSLQVSWAERYMSGGKFDLALFDHKLQLSVSQLVLWGNNHGVELYYLNPFMFYHGEQLNEEQEVRANTLGLLDVVYYPKPGLELYGQLLIDDIQIEKTGPGDLEPNEIGFMLGAQIADLPHTGISTVGIEYTRVTNRTYNTSPLAEKYVHRNKPIGHFLGNDFDRWLIHARKVFPHDLLFSASFDYRRHGEGRFNGPFDTPWVNFTVEEGYSEPFPTGVVETSKITSLALRWHPKWWGFAELVSRFSLYDNFENVENKTHRKNEIFVRLWLEWDRFFEI